LSRRYSASKYYLLYSCVLFSLQAVLLQTQPKTLYYMHMYVDFHTHIHSYVNYDAVSEIIRQNKIISVGCSVDRESYELTKRLAQSNRFIIPTFGIHPMHSDTIKTFCEIDSLLNESKIIGEIGLDNCWFKNIDLKVQEKVFEYILDHCNKYHKYCVIHTKNAEKRVLDILSNYPGAKPVIHWYDGPVDVYEKMLERNYSSTFGCEVYYSEHIKELLRITPDNRILSETDNPESEKWLGGNTDSPELIKRVVKDISEVKKINLEEMGKIIYDNSLAIFRESGVMK
jgi:TatD DNase family protein